MHKNNTNYNNYKILSYTIFCIFLNTYVASHCTCHVNYSCFKLNMKFFVYLIFTREFNYYINILELNPTLA